MSRIPIAGIGRKTPPGVLPPSNTSRVNEGVAGLVGNEQALAGINPGLLVLLRQIREVQIQTSTLKELMLQKGVFIDMEWLVMERRMTTAADAELAQMMNSLVMCRPQPPAASEQSQG